MEKHQKLGGSMRNKPKTTTTQCIPRLRNNSSSCTTKSHRFTPASLLERFRETVFRMIMLSALSKANSNNNNHPTSSSNAKSCATPSSLYYYYNPADAHHSEAVKDCIEFIKKNSSSLEENCECVNGSDSSSSSPMDVAAEVVLPVPVM